jgi:esterase/lipase superfamily enzyme
MREAVTDAVTDAVTETFIRRPTPHLERDLEMLVFGHAGLPVLFFPTSTGHYDQAKGCGLVSAVSPFLEAGRIRLYCPDGIDEESWSNYLIPPAERIRIHVQWERAMLDLIDQACEETGAARVAVAGCSFGGYHAANLAFRHPDRVCALISMSGAFDIRQLLLGYYDQDCYFNNPVDYLPGLEDPQYLEPIRRMGIVLSTGEWDICREANVRLSGILARKDIAHWLDVRPGAVHDWPLWRETFPLYISQIVRH